jgi:hypothetical protein
MSTTSRPPRFVAAAERRAALGACANCSTEGVDPGPRPCGGLCAALGVRREQGTSETLATSWDARDVRGTPDPHVRSRSSTPRNPYVRPLRARRRLRITTGRLAVRHGLLPPTTTTTRSSPHPRGRRTATPAPCPGSCGEDGVWGQTWAWRTGRGPLNWDLSGRCRLVGRVWSCPPTWRSPPRSGCGSRRPRRTTGSSASPRDVRRLHDHHHALLTALTAGRPDEPPRPWQRPCTRRWRRPPHADRPCAPGCAPFPRRPPLPLIQPRRHSATPSSPQDRSDPRRDLTLPPWPPRGVGHPLSSRCPLVVGVISWAGTPEDACRAGQVALARDHPVPADPRTHRLTPLLRQHGRYMGVETGPGDRRWPARRSDQRTGTDTADLLYGVARPRAKTSTRPATSPSLRGTSPPSTASR